MQKIAGVRCCGELSSLAPTHQTCPREDIGDRILLSMVVNAGFAARRDDEYAAPHWANDALARGDRRQALRSWCLRRTSIECLWGDDADAGLRVCGHVNASGFDPSLARVETGGCRDAAFNDCRDACPYADGR